jgi:hypothetical protein
VGRLGLALNISGVGWVRWNIPVKVGLIWG